MHSRIGKAPGEWDTIKRDFLKELRDRTGADFTLRRKNGRWAMGDRGVVAIVSGEERPEGDRWFMGLDDRILGLGQVALGVFLVCERRNGQRIVLGFEKSRWDSLAPEMSRDGTRGELKFDLRRRGDRYFLARADVTSALDDVSWLDAERSTGPSTSAESAADTPSTPCGAENMFFARVRGTVLEPLDPTGLSDGDVVLVTTTPAAAPPSNATLRRIIAAGGPPSLPRDFADQHDMHAHGAPKR